ncbi:MAG TPA: hypothetical protein VK498_10060 [Ferruginibacter sp.]|nr:hypothetical protein [Ferruginibacter sp.]
MNNEISGRDTLDSNDFEKKALPSGLNVLTILSFIGCALQLLGALWGFYSAKTSYDNKDKVLEQINSGKMPAWAKSMMGDMEHFEDTIIKSYENRLPILIISLVSVFLCFYGLLQMRKLKKQGYLFYVIGEILPFISLLLFIGTFAVTGTGAIIGVCIALLFIIMYTTYRKNLIY